MLRLEVHVMLRFKKLNLNIYTILKGIYKILILFFILIKYLREITLNRNLFSFIVLS